MKIKLFYHVIDRPGWKLIMSDQVAKMRSSGLLDVAEAYFCTHGNVSSYDEIKQELAECNINWVHLSNRIDLWEWHTLKFLHEHCKNSDEEFYVCYLHLKGITRPNNPCVTDWRNYMDYWNIERWEDCVEGLNRGYDTCGASFIEETTQHYVATITRGDGTILAETILASFLKSQALYQGNFWWSRASYIRKLEELPDPNNDIWNKCSNFSKAPYDPISNHYRLDHEYWICSGKPNWVEVFRSFSTPENLHYKEPFPSELYRGKPATFVDKDTDRGYNLMVPDWVKAEFKKLI